MFKSFFWIIITYEIFQIKEKTKTAFMKSKNNILQRASASAMKICYLEKKKKTEKVMPLSTTDVSDSEIYDSDRKY